MYSTGAKGIDLWLKQQKYISLLLDASNNKAVVEDT
jgi:hypothetical protein